MVVHCVLCIAHGCRGSRILATTAVVLTAKELSMRLKVVHMSLQILEALFDPVT
jgi:hypothetical protein